MLFRIGPAPSRGHSPRRAARTRRPSTSASCSRDRRERRKTCSARPVRARAERPRRLATRRAVGASRAALLRRSRGAPVRDGRQPSLARRVLRPAVPGWRLLRRDPGRHHGLELFRRRVLVRRPRLAHARIFQQRPRATGNSSPERGAQRGRVRGPAPNRPLGVVGTIFVVAACAVLIVVGLVAAGAVDRDVISPGSPTISSASRAQPPLPPRGSDANLRAGEVSATSRDIAPASSPQSRARRMDEAIDPMTGTTPMKPPGRPWAREARASRRARSRRRATLRGEEGRRLRPGGAGGTRGRSGEREDRANVEERREEDDARVG